MRSSLLILLFILFSVSLVHIGEAARKGAGDYWKSIMQDEPMPKALTDLVHKDSTSDDDDDDDQHGSSKTLNRKRFLTDFDTSPNVIIYHSNVVIH